MYIVQNVEVVLIGDSQGHRESSSPLGLDYKVYNLQDLPSGAPHI